MYKIISKIATMMVVIYLATRMTMAIGRIKVHGKCDGDCYIYLVVVDIVDFDVVLKTLFKPEQRRTL